MNASAGRGFAIGKGDGLFHSLDNVLEYGHGVIGIDKPTGICKNNLSVQGHLTHSSPKTVCLNAGGLPG